MNDEQNQTVQASPEGTVTAPNGDVMATDKESVEFSQTSGEGTLSTTNPEAPAGESPAAEPTGEQVAEAQETAQETAQENVAADNEQAAQEVQAPAKKLYYMGKEILEKTETFDAHSGRLCKLADGTTAYVPFSILGE